MSLTTKSLKGSGGLADFKETAIGYLDVDPCATFSSSERKWINKILKYAESHPDMVRIKCYPEDNFGELVADIPKSWLKISPPRTVNYTDEQRAAMAERMKNLKSK